MHVPGKELLEHKYVWLNYAQKSFFQAQGSLMSLKIFWLGTHSLKSLPEHSNDVS